MTIFIFGIILSNDTTAQTESSKYTNKIPSLGITITRASNWFNIGGHTLYPNVNNILHESVSLEISKPNESPQEASLQQIAEKEASVDNGQISLSKAVELNGKPAHLVLYTYQSEEGSQRVTITSIENEIDSSFLVFKYKAPESEYR